MLIVAYVYIMLYVLGYIYYVFVDKMFLFFF